MNLQIANSGTSDFVVESLRPEAARLVYPLIRAAEPAVDLASWLAYARRVLRAGPDGRSGIVVVTRVSQRFPSGMFCYRCQDDLARGRVVIADYFLAVDILDPRPVARAMAAALEQLGRRLHCNAVRSVVHRGAEDLGECLLEAGHCAESTDFIKDVPVAIMAAQA